MELYASHDSVINEMLYIISNILSLLYRYFFVFNLGDRREARSVGLGELPYCTSSTDEICQREIHATWGKE